MCECVCGDTCYCVCLGICVSVCGDTCHCVRVCKGTWDTDHCVRVCVGICVIVSLSEGVHVWGCVSLRECERVCGDVCHCVMV